MKLSTLLAALQLEQRFACDPEISGISTLLEASASQLSYATNHRHLDALRTTQAAAVLVPEQFREEPGENTLAVVTDNPELAMAQASRLFKVAIELPEADSRQIDPTAVIFPNVSLGSNVSIGRNARILPGVYLGDGVVVGEETVIHPNCVIYQGCRIGNRCIIHGNTVIGSDGFGYAHTKQGEHVKIEQLGNVVIEDDVEIGSNTSIDRATFTSTVIRTGTKIDNLVHISHNVEVGEHSLIAGQTGIAGSTTLGRNVVLAAQSGVTGHIRLADFTTVAARGGVSKDTEAGKTYAGFPMMEHKAWLRFQARLARLVKSSG